MRALVLAAALLLLAPATALGATKTYSSGPLAAAIPAGSTLEHSIPVPDAGPVSHVTVSIRLVHPHDRDLTLTLTSPAGTTVTLSAGRGAGANYGAGPRGCAGTMAVFDDDGEPIASGRSPFADGPYAPEQPLSAFNGGQASGRWTLRVKNAGQSAGTLLCWKLELSRDVVEVRKAQADGVTALLSFRESADLYRDLRLRIVRRGRVAFDAGLGLGKFWRPVAKPIVRRLDGDREPEVLVDLYSGGAHCCTFSRVYRYRGGKYAALVHDWGNVGYRLGDPDRDGRPEFLSADDRFAYAFVAFAASAEPARVWHYDRGRFVDATRRFPTVIARDAAALKRLYLSERRRRQSEVRGVLAAWLADELLLGRGAEGWKTLDEAERRGELGPTGTKDGYPAGRRYLAALRSFLRKTGYL